MQRAPVYFAVPLLWLAPGLQMAPHTILTAVSPHYAELASSS